MSNTSLTHSEATSATQPSLNRIDEAFPNTCLDDVIFLRKRAKELLNELFDRDDFTTFHNVSAELSDALAKRQFGEVAKIIQKVENLLKDYRLSGPK